MNSLDKPIIFFGTGRSGTTVISNIIMKHRDLGFPSQYLNLFPRFTLVNYLRILFENKIWQLRSSGSKSVLNKLTFHPVEGYKMWEYLSGPETDFSRDFLIGAAPGDERKKFIHNYFQNLVQKQFKKRLTFKIAGPSRLHYLSAIFPDAYYINITRNTVPVITSYLKVPFWKERGYKQLWWLGAYSKQERKWAEQNADNPLRLTSFQLNKVLEITSGEIRELDLKVKEISYDDFIINPESKIREILDYVELDYDTSCFSYLRKLTIRNRNMKDEDYFTKPEMEEIKNTLTLNLNIE